jgi:mono/diheme cytochrome c family protein
MPDGTLVYKNHCASCHSAIGDGRAPGLPSLMYMSPRSILSALESGRMKAVGDLLDPELRRAVAE